MINELDSLVERLIYERSPAERKKIALKISEFGEDAIVPLLQAIDRTWETIDIDQQFRNYEVPNTHYFRKHISETTIKESEAIMY
jgi:hypothetical protein